MKYVLLTIYSVLFLTFSTVALAWSGRDLHEVHKFRATHPCPSTHKTTGACKRYVIDHVIPLCLHGPDKATNMQWQTKQAAAKKDKRERAACRKANSKIHLKINWRH